MSPIATSPPRRGDVAIGDIDLRIAGLERLDDGGGQLAGGGRVAEDAGIDMKNGHGAYPFGLQILCCPEHRLLPRRNKWLSWNMTVALLETIGRGEGLLLRLSPWGGCA